MHRRRVLKGTGAAALLALARPGRAATLVRRARPSDHNWPSKAAWNELREAVGGRLISVESPLASCLLDPGSPACQDVLKALRNPFFIGDHPGATQTTGWADAWMMATSAYAVAAQDTSDVVAAVNFARRHNLRLVVRGGGHSYQGTSTAAGSLMVWTRAMNRIELHGGFTAKGSTELPVPAVSVGAGAIWMQVYESVTTMAGRYVQGGGCTTVGVVGLLLGGGYGSFSKNYGLAAASLLEAEVVTADGAVHITNAGSEPDLFWALKGGGGGNFGVVTRVTLRTHDLPAWFGGAKLNVRANSPSAYRRLIGQFLNFYVDALFNPNWGESVSFHGNDTLSVALVAQGLDQAKMIGVWQPFLDWIAAAPTDFSLIDRPVIGSTAARVWWDPAFREAYEPTTVVVDTRSGGQSANFWWSGDDGQVGWFLHAFESIWLSAELLAQDKRESLADTIFAASRAWTLTLQFNKGLAGASEAVIQAARDTSINPAALDAFALAISAGAGPPAYPDVQGHVPDLDKARADAASVNRCAAELRKLVPNASAYVAESSYFQFDWPRAFWGTNYARLRAIKKRYDPGGLFITHHGVGSEDWSADGFEQL